MTSESKWISNIALRNRNCISENERKRRRGNREYIHTSHTSHTLQYTWSVYCSIGLTVLYRLSFSFPLFLMRFSPPLNWYDWIDIQTYLWFAISCVCISSASLFCNRLYFQEMNCDMNDFFLLVFVFENYNLRWNNDFLVGFFLFIRIH